MRLPSWAPAGAQGAQDYYLCAANGTTILTYGWDSRSLNLGLRRDFVWHFVIAVVGLPIIGPDLLSNYELLVDCRNNRLLDGVTSLSTPHATPRRTTIGSTRQTHRRRHATREPSGGVSWTDQASREPSGDSAQHNTSHPHNNQPTSSLPPTPPGPRPFSRRQARVRTYAAERHCQTRGRLVVVRPPSRAQEGQRWKPCEEYRALNASHHSTQISSPTHTGLFPPPFRLLHLFQNRPGKSLTSNPCPS